jgi:uncharacterized membrane protein YgdD (TMEM256/DUF423 family)
VARAFLLIACLLGFLGVAFGAFGSHALRARLTPERLAQFETGVRYQLWHALALFAVVFVDVPRGFGWTSYARLTAFPPRSPWPAIAGWLFVAGILLFSGSLYALALTGVRRWGAVTPFGGVCLLGGWAILAVAVATRPYL